ncbi:hypothetical protein ID144_23715 [Pseudomonas sp. JM0905a]|uniref:hypothetical protein n=1 Tax=Pseudomonas sp. JM0905a TaxID=2772484 RepID=UPI001687DB15|nr:hypothetical protein [Pseudomonas sp. JM0905a]MBD2840055.1 hypothetical protein [Pseudomonas sp. JM0905a]
MDATERILRERYAPDTLDKTPEKSGVYVSEINKSASLPNLFDFDNVGDWLAAIEVDMHGWPLKLRQAIIHQALQAYLKE